MVNIWYPATWLFFPCRSMSHIPGTLSSIFLGMYGNVYTRSSITGTKGTRLDPAAWASGDIRIIRIFMAYLGGTRGCDCSGCLMPGGIRIYAGDEYTVISSEEKRSRVNYVRFTAPLRVSDDGVFTLIAVSILLLYEVFGKEHSVFRVGRDSRIRGDMLRQFSLFRCRSFSVKAYVPIGCRIHGFRTAPEYGKFRAILAVFFGNQRTYTGFPPNFIEHSVFVGIGGLVLAIIGSVILVPMVRLWIMHRTSREVLLYGCGFFGIALFGVWVSLGPNAPIDLQYALWRIVPMYHYLRIPPRHLILAVFGLAGLAGIGLAAIRASQKNLRI